MITDTYMTVSANHSETFLYSDNCRAAEFPCGNPQCVPSALLCNGIADCSDETDESIFAGCSKYCCGTFL